MSQMSSIALARVGVRTVNRSAIRHGPLGLNRRSTSVAGAGAAWDSSREVAALERTLRDAGERLELWGSWLGCLRKCPDATLVEAMAAGLRIDAVTDLALLCNRPV